MTNSIRINDIVVPLIGDVPPGVTLPKLWSDDEPISLVAIADEHASCTHDYSSYEIALFDLPLTNDTEYSDNRLIVCVVDGEYSARITKDDISAAVYDLCESSLDALEILAKMGRNYDFLIGEAYPGAGPYWILVEPQWSETASPPEHAHYLREIPDVMSSAIREFDSYEDAEAYIDTYMSSIDVLSPGQIGRHKLTITE